MKDQQTLSSSDQAALHIKIAQKAQLGAESLN